MNRSTVIDKVGNYLTPALLITLLAIVVLAIVNPIDTLHSSSISTAKESFLNGFFTVIKLNLTCYNELYSDNERIRIVYL